MTDTEIRIERHSWAFKHLALVWTLFAVVLSLTRVFRVAHNDPSTALAVFAHMGALSTVVGIALTDMQRIVELSFLLLFIAYLDAEYPWSERNRREINVLAALLTMFGLLVVAVGHIVFAVVLTLVGFRFILRRLLEPFLLTRDMQSTMPEDSDTTRIRDAEDDSGQAVESRWGFHRLKGRYQDQRARFFEGRNSLTRWVLIREHMTPEIEGKLDDRDFDTALEILPDRLGVTRSELESVANKRPPKFAVNVWRRRVTSAILILAIPYAGGLFFSDTPWLPKEVIARNADDDRLGYILQDENETLVVLWDHPRAVERIDRVEVNRRQICRSSAGLPRYPTLPEIMSGAPPEPDYIACTESQD